MLHQARAKKEEGFDQKEIPKILGQKGAGGRETAEVRKILWRASDCVPWRISAWFSLALLREEL
jgi:hypothetical protein